MLEASPLTQPPRCGNHFFLIARRAYFFHNAAMSTLKAALKLRDTLTHYPDLAPMGTIAYILNPIEYAWKNHADYITRYAPDGHRVEAILLGMNPGPWGMAQTGIPFGTSTLVRDFLGITGEVDQPKRFHPKRPIHGIQCKTQEVSGMRLWGAIRDCFGTPEAFFARFYVANYCPLAFQDEKGANITPDKLPKALWEECSAACQAHLAEVVTALRPQMIIGVGKWAQTQADIVRKVFDLPVETASILHPSPASPAANRGWKALALAQLEKLGHPWPTG